MPSAGYPVQIPDDLKGVHADDQPARMISAALIRSLIALLMIVSGAVMVGFGVGAWLCPAAGLAAAGVYVGAIGFALAFTD